MSNLFDEMMEEISEKDKKISDLETKLADSKSRFQVHKNADASIIQEQTDLIEQLKQQLAEKDEEIEKLRDFERDWKRWYKLAFDYNEEINRDKKIIFNLRQEIDKLNQEKISFAVEQLEKVKELFGTKCGYCAETDLCWDIEQYIDKQIKQLKEGK